MTRSIGKLTPFYRNTQQQGHRMVSGEGLIEVPEYLLSGIDFIYPKKKSSKEVLFVDHVSITRFLGGYSPEWHDIGANPSRLDMAYVDEDGGVRYRWNLIEEKLGPLIRHGYTGFTIGIENIPWDLARSRRSDADDDWRPVLSGTTRRRTPRLLLL